MRGFRQPAGYRVRNGLTAIAVLVASVTVFGSPAQAANPSADLDQCENGPVTAPKPCDWVNGNLNASNSYFGEGHSLPYRVRFANLAAGPHTVTIAWDTTKGGKHALDYLTTYNRTETTADPCPGCGVPSTLPIPLDPFVSPLSGFAGTQVPGVFTMWGGTPTAASAYTRAGSYAGDSTTSITLTFTVASAGAAPVLAWGGHLATRLDWGATNAASGITGSPYHMSLLDLDGSGGNQDRSLAAEAVVFPSSITIVKQASPEGSRQFAFTASDGLGSFTLVDDGLDNVAPENSKKFDGLTDFYDNSTRATYDFTETVPAGWALSSISCSAGSTVTTDVATATLSVRLAEATDVVCTFTNADVVPTMTVTKVPRVASVMEPGGPVTFDVRVANGSAAEPITLTDLDDSVFGDIDLVTNSAITSRTCTVPQVIVASGNYSCAFTATVAGNGDETHANTVTATGTDAAANTLTAQGSATVAIQDRLPAVTVTKTPTPASVPEPGGNVSFAVRVTNGTVEAVTLDDLTDSVFGDIDPSNTAIVSTTCAVPRALAGSASYSCAFTAFVGGDAGDTHVNTVEADVSDDDGNTASGTGGASVAVTDVLPAVSVTKTPRLASVPETGAEVTFDVVATNQSVEPVTLYELSDSVFGNVADAANAELASTTCALPATLTKPGSYSCSFTALVAGGGGTSHANVVTARVRDNEANTASATAPAAVAITDVPPQVRITKTPSATLVRSGTAVTYTYRVTNPGTEALVVVTVTDDKCSPVVRTGGDTDGDGTLDPGEEWVYTCTATLTGTTVNTASVVAEDDEGTGILETATATVEVIDPRIDIDKSADPPSATPGQTVTYTYVVTNPGDGPLRDVQVGDDKCSPVTFAGGDADADGLLDVGESWTYTCAQVIGSSGSSLTNIGTVTAVDGTGATVSADDSETITIVLGATFERPREVLGVELPRTGAGLALWALTGLGLLVAGGGLVGAGRRRRPTSP